MYIHSWYRGKVIAASRSMLEIYFVDYGDTAWVNSDFVKPISSPLSKVCFCSVIFPSLLLCDVMFASFPFKQLNVL